MQRPVQIVFRNMDASAALEQEVRARAEWLDAHHPGIVGCRVLLERPHRHRRRGNPLHVRVELSLPGEDVVVTHEPPNGAADLEAVRKSDELDDHYKDAYVAVHEAFAIARRRLVEEVARRRGEAGSAPPAGEPT